MPLYMWSDPQVGYLTTYSRLTAPPPNTQEKMEHGANDSAYINIHADTDTGNDRSLYIHTETKLHLRAKKSRPGLDGLNGLVPPVLRGNVLLCCERLLPLSGAPAWGQTGGC